MTCKLAVFPFAAWTTISTELTSGSSNGTCALIWVGEANKSGAGIPPNKTWVPPSRIGRGKPLEETGPVARLLPWIETMDPRAATGTLDELLLVAAFTRAVMLGPGACAGNDSELKSQMARIAADFTLPRP